MAAQESGGQGYYAKVGGDPLTQAFEDVKVVHAGFGGRSVEEPERAVLLAELLGEPRRGDSVAYVHVPFCQTRCAFCGFYNLGYRESESAAYVDSLLREVGLWRDYPAQEGGPIRALYLGGGTPTALRPADMRRLLIGLREELPLANDCEITVEGRIHDLMGEKVRACLDGGANRFSLGVQTFDSGLRRSMGRIAASEDVVEGLRRLREADQTSVVIDLIYGLPGQTPELWLEDIERFLELELDGVDFYQLKQFKGTPLHKAVAKGSMPQPPSLAERAGMFALAVERMESARWRRLSVNHWGKGTRERNIYNAMAKSPTHCLAFGPGAGGNLKGYFFFVQRDYETWKHEVRQGRKPLMQLTRPGPHWAFCKWLAAELELGRLNLREVQEAAGFSAGRRFEPLLRQWEKAGLLEFDGEWVELTVAGQFWEVKLAQLMIEYFQEHLEEKNAVDASEDV